MYIALGSMQRHYAYLSNEGAQTTRICLVFMYWVRGAVGWLVEVLGDRQTELALICQTRPRNELASCSEAALPGTAAQLRSCNLSSLSRVPNDSSVLLLWEVFFLSWTFALLNSPEHPSTRDTFVSLALTAKGFYRINVCKQTFNLVFFSLQGLYL